MVWVRTRRFLDQKKMRLACRLFDVVFSSSHFQCFDVRVVGVDASAPYHRVVSSIRTCLVLNGRSPGNLF